MIFHIVMLVYWRVTIIYPIKSHKIPLKYHKIPLKYHKILLKYHKIPLCPMKIPYLTRIGRQSPICGTVQEIRRSDSVKRTSFCTTSHGQKSTNLAMVETC